MQAVAGVFQSRKDAGRGYAELRRAGYDPDDINLLSPGDPSDAVENVPTTDTEQPGVGKALGGVVGAALGMAGGFELGVGVTALVPGVGPVLAAGLAGMALLGAGGAMAGAAAAGKMEETTTPGLPADEIFFYEDALRQGRTVIVVMANGATEGRRAQEILTEAGAESIDAARQAWWVGLRSAESEHYVGEGETMVADEAAYRAGFEAALRREVRGNSYEASADRLRAEFPDVWQSGAFRAGFERGRQYAEQRVVAPPTKS
jgi:hypothetical protein